MAPRRVQFLGVALLTFLSFGNFSIRSASAQTDATPVKQQVDALNGQVQDKQDRIKELDRLIGDYQKRIQSQDTQQASLQNEVLLLDNRIREKELSVERAKTELESLNLEIQALGENIQIGQDHISKQKELIAELMRRVRQADEVSPIDVLLTQPTLSSFFDRVEQIKTIERDLGTSLDKLKTTKTQLEDTQKQRDDRKGDVILQQKALRQQQERMEEEKNFKISLVSQTQQSQAEFERTLYELKQQQQSTTDDISMLETKLKDTLNAVDASLARGDILLSWPIQPANGISAHFHDTSYPFRNLFEHPGTDIRTPVGTPVHAAAGGYVAWNKTGRQYGNYIMIVHPGGIATIYAHLTRFIAKPDTYVERGDVIGLSGGRPGDQGAGLSTGPHLHFEVRQDGIPVNAENFLPTMVEGN